MESILTASTNLIDLIKFADNIQSNIRKFIFQEREENWKQLLNCCILAPSAETVLSTVKDTSMLL